MAFQKVMISGIHTSELTVLKEEEKMALLREIQETGSKAARDKLIQGNLLIYPTYFKCSPDSFFFLELYALKTFFCNFSMRLPQINF